MPSIEERQATIPQKVRNWAVWTVALIFVGLSGVYAYNWFVLGRSSEALLSDFSWLNWVNGAAFVLLGVVYFVISRYK
jgi:hypothetical protein